jgi:thiamine kinase-like enzyme
MTAVQGVVAVAAEARRPADMLYDAECACPAHILSFLQHHLGGENPLHIHVEKSAQQSVLILCYAKPPPNNSSENEEQSSFPSKALTGGCCKEDENTLHFWRHALIQGNYRLVVRCWKGGSRWWNLHCNNNTKSNIQKSTSVTGQNGCTDQNASHHHRTAVQELATSEIAGYKIARICLMEAANNRMRQTHHHQHYESSNLVIPTVLHADTEDCNEPWAIFEYVGRHNPRFFCSSSSSSDDHSNIINNNDDNNNSIYDDYWTRNMILVRDEFGYAEPHPRWGRVPIDECLAYATTVLVQVIIPLHVAFATLQKGSVANSSNSNSNHHGSNGIQKRGNELFQQALQNLSGWKESSDTDERGYTYETMIVLCKSAWKEMSSFMDSSDNIDLTTKNDINNNIEDRRLRHAIQLLGRCIDRLQHESEDEEIIKPLPPVLVHMDCQPQNLLFARRRCGDDGNGKQPSSSSSLHVSSLLDWEEAAYADPRFELLLLGRKVCANQAQAEQIWNLYERQRENVQLGPIDPWLCLETVHSLATLLLQAMDLAGGGRCPWESKPDLWGRIEREFGRLVARGWSFCR